MKILRRAAVIAACLALMPLQAALAHPADSKPGAQLRLTVTDASGYSYWTDVQCMPSGGVDSWSPCYDLKQADGNFDNLSELDWKMCTEEWDPVIFSARGTWKGQEVDWSKKFGNECTGHRKTGGVFDF